MGGKGSKGQTHQHLYSCGITTVHFEVYDDLQRDQPTEAMVISEYVMDTIENMAYRDA